MIKEISREDGPFEHDEAGLPNYYYVGLIDGKPYGYLHLQKLKDVGYVHLHIDGFSKRILRQMRGDLELVKKTIACIEISYIIGMRKLDKAAKLLQIARLLGKAKVTNDDKFLTVMIEV